MDRVFLKRLTVAHSAIALVILLSTATALYVLRSVARETERTSEIDRRLESVEQLRSDAVELARSARRFLLDADLRDQRRVFVLESEMRRVRSSLGDYAQPLDASLDDYIRTVVHNMTADGSPPGTALGAFEDALRSVRSALWASFDELLVRDRRWRENAQAPDALVGGAEIALVVAALLGAALVVGGLVAIDRMRRHPARGSVATQAALERIATARRELLTAATALRAPLEQIQRDAGLLRGAARDEQREPLDGIASAALRVDRMLRDLLDVTSVQIGEASLRRELCQSASLIEPVIAEHRERARARGIRLRADARPVLPVSIDRERVAHVLSLLVGAALDSARIGAEIVVGVAPYPDGVRFTISDASYSVRATSLQPAFATSPSSLALQLGQSVIEAHGGRLGVERSQTGQTYSFTLPTEPSLLK